ncbi:hypothetical protein [Bifidobacterium callitrichidarum]|uniref:Uncharacterized protein n=1 Tax=Bifidobacterium callitrichidarum TaxID=2052941 RepID=A0A2U2NCC8_9BIFI|nr:hypothetical protein [Bifidobacterium callitrichidarum]PWG66747.1 hypothetical protein DF196_02255 [Bifidobacterium callitrichidarum]
MLTVEYKTKTGEWIKAIDKEWATRRGVEHWLNHTWAGVGLTCRYEHVRVVGEESRRKPFTGIDPTGWVHVGDVFHCRWGYDTINNDFYEVVSVSPSGKTCTIRQINTLIDGDPNYPGGCYARPQLTGDDHFCGQPIPRKRIRVFQPTSGRASCSITMSPGMGSAMLMEPEDYVQGYMEDHCD